MDKELNQPSQIHPQTQEQPSVVPHQVTPVPRPKKGHRRLWVLLSIAILLLASIILVYAFVYVPRANAAAQSETIKTYCDALKRRDYPTAYNQLSSRLRAAQTEQQFAAASGTLEGGIAYGSGSSSSNLGSVVECDYDSAGAFLHYKFSSGTFLLSPMQFVQESGVWKV